LSSFLEVSPCSPFLSFVPDTRSMSWRTRTVPLSTSPPDQKKDLHPGKSCLFANTINKQSLISRSARILSNSNRASSILSLSPESMTKINPCYQPHAQSLLPSDTIWRKRDIPGYQYNNVSTGVEFYLVLLHPIHQFSSRLKRPKGKGDIPRH
jgi:hypothetical protein